MSRGSIDFANFAASHRQKLGRFQKHELFSFGNMPGKGMG